MKTKDKLKKEIEVALFGALFFGLVYALVAGLVYALFFGLVYALVPGILLIIVQVVRWFIIRKSNKELKNEKTNN